MTEKRRGIAIRAKVSGSAVSSFRSPIYPTPSVSVSVFRFFVKRFSVPSNRARAKGLFIKINIFNSTIYGDIKKDAPYNPRPLPTAAPEDR